MLLKIVAYMDDQPRRAKDLEDIRGLLAEYEADSERVFFEIVIDAELEDYGLAPAFLMGPEALAGPRPRTEQATAKHCSILFLSRANSLSLIA